MNGTLRGGLLVLVLASGLLAASYGALGAGRLHLLGLGGTLNDQAGYVTTARNLAEGGGLSATMIYPSLLAQGARKGHLYMPGHYGALAASYRLLGAGPLASQAPALAAFIVTALLVYLIGVRLAGPGEGLAASVLWMLWPANALYAVTAMMEGPVVAATALALALFLATPARWRPAAGPVVLVIPFLFRETTALLAVPMAIFIARDGPRPRPGRAAAFLGGAVVVLGLVYRSDLSAGRGSLLAGNLFRADPDRLYAGSSPWPEVPPSPSEWAAAVASNGWRNARTLAVVLLKGGAGCRPVERLSLGLLALLHAAGAAGLAARGDGVTPSDDRSRMRRAFLAAALAFGAANLAFVALLYEVAYFRGLRLLMVAAPPACVAAAVGVGRWAGPIRRPILVGAAVLAAAALVAFEALALAPALAEGDAREDEGLARIEALGHDDATLLVCDLNLAARYVVEHAPTRWSFVPHDRAALDLLAGRFRVGTMILDDDQARRLGGGEGPLPGFREVGPIVIGGRRYRAYRPLDALPFVGHVRQNQTGRPGSPDRGRRGGGRRPASPNPRRPAG